MKELICIQEDITDERLNEILARSFRENYKKTIISCFFLYGNSFGLNRSTIGIKCFSYISRHYPQLFIKIYHLIPIYGKWNDLLCIDEPSIYHYIDTLIQIQLYKETLSMMKGEPISRFSFQMYYCIVNPDRLDVLLKHLELTHDDYYNKLTLLLKYKNYKEEYKNLFSYKTLKWNKFITSNFDCYVFCEVLNNFNFDTMIDYGLQLISHQKKNNLQNTINEMYKPYSVDLNSVIQSLMYNNYLPSFIVIITDAPFQQMTELEYIIMKNFSLKYPTIIYWDCSITTKNFFIQSDFIFLSGDLFDLLKMILSIKDFKNISNIGFMYKNIHKKILEHSFFEGIYHSLII